MLLVSQAAVPIRFFPRFAADYKNIMHDSMTMPPTVVALDVFGGNYVRHLMQTLQSQHGSFSRVFRHASLGESAVSKR